MPEYILLMLIVLFFIYAYLWDKKLLKSIVFSLFFVFSLWINIPCFIDITIVKFDNVIIMFPFILYDKWGLLYIIFANIIMAVVIYLQDFFTNKSFYSYREMKKIYDNYGMDGVELYIIGKDVDFLFRDGFEK